MNEKFTLEELKIIEGVRKLYRETNGKDISSERAAELVRFSNMLMQIASGKFHCEKCGGEQQIYVFQHQ